MNVFGETRCFLKADKLKSDFFCGNQGIVFILDSWEPAKQR